LRLTVNLLLTVDVLKNVSVMPRQLKTHDQRSVSRMFADSWETVTDKEIYKTIPTTKTLVDILNDRLEDCKRKLGLINIAFFYILGGEETRGPNFKPTYGGNSLTVNYVNHFEATAEAYYFTFKSAARKDEHIPNFLLQIQVDNTDMDYLRNAVKRTLLVICSKMSILINLLVNVTGKAKVPYKKYSDWDHHYTGVPPHLDISKLAKFNKDALRLMAHCLNNGEIKLEKKNV